MSCTSCKKSKQEIVEKAIEEIKVNQKNGLKEYIIKSLLYLILLTVLTPVILVVFVVILFKIVVLSREINLLPLVYHIGKMIFREKDNDDDDDDDDFEEPIDGIHELAEPDEIIELK